MTQARRRGSAAGALALLAATFATSFLLVAPPAHGQVTAIEVPLPDTSGTVDSVGGAVDDTTSDAGKVVGGVVEDTTDAVGGAVEDTGNAVGDTVKDTGGSVGDAVGGPVGDAVKDTSGSVGDTVKDTSGTVGDAVKNTGGSFGQEVDKTVSTVGKTVGGTVEGILDGSEIDGGLLGPGGMEKGNPTVDGRSTVISSGGSGLAGSSSSPGSSGSFALANDIQDLEFGTELVGAATDVRAPIDFGRFVQEAIEAVRQFAFPLALTLMVVAYMVVQGRIDRRDPKLAVAALDAEQDLLNFS